MQSLLQRLLSLEPVQQFSSQSFWPRALTKTSCRLQGFSAAPAGTARGHPFAADAGALGPKLPTSTHLPRLNTLSLHKGLCRIYAGVADSGRWTVPFIFQGLINRFGLHLIQGLAVSTQASLIQPGPLKVWFFGVF